MRAHTQRVQGGFARLAAGAVVAALLIAGSPWLTPAVAGGEEPNPFPFLASLDLRDANGQVFPTNFATLAFDPDLDGGRVVAGSAFFTALVDPVTLEQTAMIDHQLPSFSAGVIALDTERHSMFRADRTCDGGLFQGPECETTAPRLGIVSLTGAFESITFSLPSDYAGQPVAALAFDQPRGVLYAITNALYGGLGIHANRTTLHAIDVVAGTGASPVPALARRWSYPIDACVSLANTGQQPYLGIATDAAFAYFGCRGLSDPITASQFAPHGAMRVNLAPGATPSDVSKFTAEYFPVAGDLSFGVTAGDPAGERVFLFAAGSGKQRVYVFDARHRAWTGSRPLDDGNVRGAGLDPSTGRLYPIQEDGGVVITDAAGVPVPQGQSYSLGIKAGIASQPVFDPGTRRLFVAGREFRLPTNLNVPSHLRVYEDLTAPADVPPVVDPDAKTHDIDEADASQVTYTGGASAYGARSRVVGGVRGTAVGFVEAYPIPTEARPEGGDRGLFLGQVSKSQLTGDSSGGSATAAATAVELDEATRTDLEAKLGINVEQLSEVVGELAASSCKDFGGEPSTATSSGSEVTCDGGHSTGASASSPEAVAGGPVTVAFAASSTRIVKDPERGVVTSAVAVARGIDILGAVHIGEVRSEAESVARGRPGTAVSEYRTSINQVRITDAAGKTAFACGWNSEGGDDAGGRCDPAAVVRAINNRFAVRVQAESGRRDTSPLVTGSPGGAQALVIKDDYARWNSYNTNGDDRQEVVGLELVVSNDTSSPSRLVVQLAAVLTEAQYVVGAPAPEVEPLDPASLAIELLDQAGDALAGGMFEVRVGADVPTPEPEPEETGADEDSGETPQMVDDPDGNDGADAEGASTKSASVEPENDPDVDDGTEAGGDPTDESDDLLDDVLDDPLGTGELIGACVTDDDGTGDCTFEDLEPGAYLVTQTAAPAGYAEAAPFPVMLTPGFASTVSFTNIKAVGTIEISLSDTADPPKPLPGGEFAVLADDGDGLLGAADVELGRCTTGADGTCDAIEAPVGTYVVHQVSAPNGLEPAADVAFAFTEPGQTAALAFVNGLPVAPAPPPAPFTPGPPAPVSSGSVAMTPPSPAPPPIVTSEPIDASAGRSPLARMASLPAQAVGFLTRSPGEAAMFAGVWSLLLAPAYLAARRRKLTLVKEGI